MSVPVVVVVGTRPDAIKLMPVYHKLRSAGVPSLLCATNQHRELLDHVFTLFDVRPDITFDIMKENQRLNYVTTAVLQKASEFFVSLTPKLVIVQGDTSSSFAAALAAYYLNIPVVHVEAGLRTWNMNAPFPEEMNRSFITKISTLHFAPTPLNVYNLLRDGVPANRIFCVGNTIVDALVAIKKKFERGDLVIRPVITTLVDRCKSNNKKLVLLTTHRRESFHGGITRILESIKHCAHKYPDLWFFFPTHPNPHIQEAIEVSGIRNFANIQCSQPIDYHELVYLLSASSFVITDSGGIQEEALSLGKNVLILRDNTERAEALWSETGILVGTDMQAIINGVDRWYNKAAPLRQHFVYGDGNTADRIVDTLLHFFSLTTVQETPISPILHNTTQTHPEI